MCPFIAWSLAGILSYRHLLTESMVALHTNASEIKPRTHVNQTTVCFDFVRDAAEHLTAFDLFDPNFHNSKSVHGSYLNRANDTAFSGLIERQAAY